ncbi:MAG: hypothetical protein H7Y04_06985, partial [Verrucomicrobia bacterium]|nr:hypothetical protein [Cytophagales bacterium]
MKHLYQIISKPFTLGSLSSVCFILLLFFLNFSAHAQISNQRTKWMKISEKTILLDTLTAFPESIKIISKDTSLHFTYNPTNKTLTFSGTSATDSVQIYYRVFTFDIAKNRFNRDIKKYEKTFVYDDSQRFVQKPITDAKEEFFSTSGISKTGNLTRGISFGNTQNVFVDAGLNLQLEGKLSEDLNIIAAISDQNVPYQPEGNTQTLQQFDRVFVQLSGKKTKLTVGDIVLQNPVWLNTANQTSFFLRYYKNVQGGLAEIRYQPAKNQQAVTSVGGAVAKGRFAS